MTGTPASISTLVKSALVNWLPWVRRLLGAKALVKHAYD
jgi:hypothetical protein